MIVTIHSDECRVTSQFFRVPPRVFFVIGSETEGKKGRWSEREFRNEELVLSTEMTMLNGTTLQVGLEQ